MQQKSFFRDVAEFLASPFIRAWGKYAGSVIVNKVYASQIHRDTQDIGRWRRALSFAESPTQDRRALFDLYADVMLDGALKSAVRQRINAVRNQDFVFVRDGQEDDEIGKLLKTSYFSNLLNFIMNSRMYGHSLVELGWPAKGSTTKGWSAEVDRRYVKPRYGLVIPEGGSMRGYSYREKPFADTVFEFGHHEDLGDILEACQYVIYKRGGYGDWAEFAEVFGMPFRWAKYNSPETRDMLQEALKTAGSAGFVVAPEDASIETVHNSSSGGSDVYRFLVEALNKEIAICILGQSMTQNDSRNSGFAQASVHEGVQDELFAGDLKYVLAYLNETITPYLKKLGYQSEDGEFKIKDEDHLSLVQRIQVDMQVAKQVPIPASHWYDTYRISRPTAEDPPAEPMSTGGNIDQAAATPPVPGK